MSIPDSLLNEAKLLLLKATCFQTPATQPAIARLHRALTNPDTTQAELLQAKSELGGMLRSPPPEKWAEVGREPPGNWQHLRDLWIELGMPKDQPVGPWQGTITSGDWEPRYVADAVFAELKRRADGETEQPQVVAPDDQRNAVRATALEAMLSDETAKAVIKIAHSERTADAKASEICRIDRTLVYRDSTWWSELLGVTSAAMRKTQFWRIERPGIIETMKD